MTHFDYIAFTGNSFRFNRQPPETAFFSMETMLLNAAYDLVENMQRLRQSTSKEDLSAFCDKVDQDIEGLRGHLRTIKAETKLLRGNEPLSKQTDVEKSEGQ